MRMLDHVTFVDMVTVVGGVRSSMGMHPCSTIYQPIKCINHVIVVWLCHTLGTRRQAGPAVTPFSAPVAHMLI